MSTTLITHCGARVVTLEELVAIKAPEPTRTWFPLSHAHVVQNVERALGEAGFRVERSRYAVSRTDARLFAVLDLASVLATGVTLSVGIRNSLDKSLPIGFCAGSRVFCCDNLAFRGEITVARKHTRFGDQRFIEALARAIRSLTQFQTAESARIRRFQQTDVNDTTAESILLRAYERGIVSHRLLPGAIRQWREPPYEEFQPRTMWSLMNALTTVLGDRIKGDAQKFARLTIQLSDLLSEAAGIRPEEQITLSE
jgi:hypothetical protein